MLESETTKLQGIGQILVLEQFLEKSEALKFYQYAEAEKMSLVHYLVKNNILSARQIAQTAADKFGLPFIDLEHIKIESIPLSLVSEQLIRQHQILPLYCRDSTLYLATDDPGKQAALKEIQFHTGLATQPVVVETDKLHSLINHLLTLKEHQGLCDYSDLLIGFQNETQVNSAIEDTPIVKFVNNILLDAIKQGASDIHFEPFENEYRIRYRQDGILRQVATPPVSLSARITARIKVMSNLDSAERRLPQDGGFKMTINHNKVIDFRVNTCPTAGGEKVVIRILDTSTAKLGVEALGFSPIQQEQFMRAISQPQGLILVTGPTGSGKTVSLYTALNLLNTNEVNISTAEDPVEMNLNGINQVNINPKVGLSFSTALRSFLRQDPDIIMVGEIRDLETAEIAVNAAQTGHLVLSTLHTNSAAETLNRLVNMGIPAFNIASSITLIIAQRLARKLCTYCKKLRTDFTRPSLLKLGFSEFDVEDIQLYEAVGCPKCTSGYQGRTGLFEVLPMNKGLGELIMSGGHSLQILKAAQSEGMISIYQSGLDKVKQGITTLEEINRVTVD